MLPAARTPHATIKLSTDRSCRMKLHVIGSCAACTTNGRRTTILKLASVPSKYSWISDGTRGAISKDRKSAKQDHSLTLHKQAVELSGNIETRTTKGTAFVARHPTISSRCNGSHIQHSGVKLRACWAAPQQDPCVYASRTSRQHPTSDCCRLMLLQYESSMAIMSSTKCRRTASKSSP